MTLNHTNPHQKNMSSKSIVKIILVTFSVYFTIYLLSYFSGLLIIYGNLIDNKLLDQFNNLTYRILTNSKPFIILILAKPACEIIYKLLRGCEIIIDKNDK